MICKYFFLFSRLTLILLMISSTVQKLFNLMLSHLFIFAFIVFLLVVVSDSKIIKTNVKELTTYVFFWELYGFRSHI